MRRFRRLMQWFHYASCGVLIALMFLTVGDVVGRYAFNRPIAGTYELTGLLAALAVFLGLGFAHLAREHITVDVVYSAVGPRVQRVLDGFATAVTVGALVVLAWGLRHFAQRMDAGGYTTSVLKVPIGPFAWCALIGTAGYALAAGADLIRQVREQGARGTRRHDHSVPMSPGEGGHRTREP